MTSEHDLSPSGSFVPILCVLAPMIAPRCWHPLHLWDVGHPLDPELAWHCLVVISGGLEA